MTPAIARRAAVAATQRRLEAVAVVLEAGAAPAPTRLRALVEQACAAGLEIAIAAAGTIEDADAWLGAPRPDGPGGLLVALDEGTRIHRVQDGGARFARQATPCDPARRLTRELWRIGIAPAQFAFVSPAELAGVLDDQIVRRRRREPPAAPDDPAWTLAVSGVDAHLERVHESLLTLADGRLGTRGSVLTGSAEDEPGVVLAGVYAGSGPEEAPLAAPRWNALTLATGPPATGGLRRVLDLRAGTLTHSLDGDGLRLDAVALSSLARPATAVLRARVRGAPAPAPGGLLAPPGATPQAGLAGDCSWMRVDEPPGSIAAAVHEQLAEQDGNGGADGAWTLDRIACYAGSDHGPADEQTALARLALARDAGFERLLGEHRRAWAARWEAADIEVAGDPALQRGVRLALFTLMSSVAGDGEAAVGARGLTGSGYRGHVFWDTDVYVLPFHAATHPPAARAMLEYRLRRLPAALRAAQALGRAGARFAWESATSGEDVTPKAARNRRGELAPVLTGELEEHIVSDIAWAAWHYTEWTGDRAFGEGPGRTLLVEAARWWASRIELGGDGSAHIRGVIGPDEYHERVDDNVYTNIMARWTLRRAAASVSPALEDAEPRRWRMLAEALADGYDPQTGLYEQFTGFFALEPVIVAQLAPRPVSADLLLGAARTHAAQVVKQPDVLMAHLLVPDEMAPGSLAANLGFYEPRTSHGSTLSPGVHAALLARAGRLDEALALVRLTAGIDLDDIGQTTAGGLHLAAMGSVWCALAYGFGGLRPSGDRLAVDPRPAARIDALDLRVRFRDSRVRLRIGSDDAQISADPPITVLTPGGDEMGVGRVPVSIGVTRPRPPAPAATTKEALR